MERVMTPFTVTSVHLEITQGVAKSLPCATKGDRRCRWSPKTSIRDIPLPYGLRREWRPLAQTLSISYKNKEEALVKVSRISMRIRYTHSSKFSSLRYSCSLAFFLLHTPIQELVAFLTFFFHDAPKVVR